MTSTLPMPKDSWLNKTTILKKEPSSKAEVKTPGLHVSSHLFSDPLFINREHSNNGFMERVLSNN